MGARAKQVTDGAESKYADISNQLRMAIVEGRFPPGTRLPVRSDLERIYGASRLTIQRSMDRLLAESFIVAKGRLGTFVSKTPPHLGRYGLVFPCSPVDSAHWVQGASVFFQAGCMAAQRMNSEVEPFYCSDTPAGLEQGKALLSIAERHMLAGVILFYLTPARMQALGLDTLALPAVHIHDPGHVRMPGRAENWMDGEFDYAGLIAKSIQMFKSRKRTRVALFCLEGVPAEFVCHFNEEIRANGLETHAYWQQAGNIDPLHHKWVCNAAELLIRSASDHRPDAVLILDENLTEPVTTGLQAAGAIIGKDCDVISQCSFPSAKTPPAGVMRIGFQMPGLVASCMEAITLRAKGEHVEPLIARALFEDE